MNRYLKDIEKESKTNAVKRAILVGTILTSVVGAVFLGDKIAELGTEASKRIEITADNISIRISTGHAVRDREIHAPMYERLQGFVDEENAKLNKYFGTNLDTPKIAVISDIAGQGFMSSNSLIMTDGMLERRDNLVREVTSHELGHRFLRELDLLQKPKEHDDEILANTRNAPYSEKLHAELYEEHGTNSRANEFLAEILAVRMNPGTDALEYREQMQPPRIGEYQTNSNAAVFLHRDTDKAHATLGQYRDLHEFINHAKDVGGTALEDLDKAIKTGDVEEILMQSSRYQTGVKGERNNIDLNQQIETTVSRVNAVIERDYPELEKTSIPLLIFPENPLRRDIDYAESDHRTVPHLTTRISDRGFGASRDGTINFDERIDLSIVQQFIDNNQAHFNNKDNGWTPFTDEGKEAITETTNQIMQQLGHNENKYPTIEPVGAITNAQSSEIEIQRTR